MRQMNNSNRLKRMTSINVQKNADIEQINETKEKTKHAEEYDINKCSKECSYWADK